MPTIKKNKPKPSARRKERQSLYQMKQWRNLSAYMRMMHPICQVCEKNVSEHVHHINSPFDYGLSEVERLARLLDPENLIAVCADCHNALHGNTKKVSQKPPEPLKK